MSRIGRAHAERMRTLTQQLDRRSCKTALRGVAGPSSLSFSSSSSSRLSRLLQGSIVTALFLVLLSLALARSSPRVPVVSSRGGTSAYFLGTYGRPRIVLFCLAAWAGSGDLGAISARRLLSFSVLFFLISQCIPLAFGLSRDLSLVGDIRSR